MRKGPEKRQAILIICGDGNHWKWFVDLMKKLKLKIEECDRVELPGGFLPADREAIVTAVRTYAGLHKVKNNEVLIFCPPNCGAYGGHPEVTAGQLSDARVLQAMLGKKGFSVKIVLPT